MTSVRDAARSVAATCGVHRFDDFIIYNEPRRRDMIRLMLRGLVAKTGL